MNYPNWGYRKESDPHYKGKFKYCDVRGDIDVSKGQLMDKMCPNIGDTAIIFGADKAVDRCIEIGRFIYDGAPVDRNELPLDGKWFWSIEKWKNGDWGEIYVKLSDTSARKSFDFEQVIVKFIIDEGGFKLVTQSQELVSSFASPEIKLSDFRIEMCSSTSRKHYKGKFTYCDDRGDIDVSRNLISQMANSTVESTAVIFGATTHDGKQVEIGKCVPVSSGDKPISDETTDVMWVWSPVKWENGAWATIDNNLSSPAPAHAVVYNTAGVNFIVDRDLHNYRVAQDYMRDVHLLHIPTMRRPNISSPQPGHLSYLGQFTYFFDVTDKTDPEEFIKTKGSFKNGERAILHNRHLPINRCIKIGEYIVTRRISDLELIGKWKWFDVEWINQDWGVVDKYVGCSNIEGPVTIKFVSDGTVHDFLAEPLNPPSLIKMEIMKSRPKWRPENRRDLASSTIIKDPCIIKSPVKVERTSPDHGKFTYFASHSNLNSAIQHIQTHTDPSYYDKAIAFSRDPNAKEHIAIGVYGDDAYFVRCWKWIYDSENWQDGDYAEIEYANLTDQLNEFSQMKRIVTFHEANDIFRRRMDIELISTPRPRFPKPTICGAIENGDLPQPRYVISDVTCDQESIQIDPAPTLADIKVYINALMELWKPETSYIEYPVNIKPFNQVEETVATKAILEYRSRVKDHLSQVERLKDMKFPYGTIVRRLDPTGLLPGAPWIGKVIGYDDENQYYRVFFTNNISYIGCNEESLELWEGEVPTVVREYTPSIGIIHVNLRGQDPGPIENKEEL